MKAILYHRYGSPDVLQLEEIERPSPGDDEVLIKVRAASVNPYDWHFMRGEPVVGRLMTGLRKPKAKFTRLGVDVAGVVEAVGKNVTRLEPGDEVFGATRGAWAEYACTRESALVAKSASMTFEQAASIAVAGLTALQSLRKGGIHPGQKVLINGAAGGVGTFAVQFAKSYGADVTAVCSTRNVEMVRSLGADRVIDYTQEDFTRSAERYDLLVDCIGNHSWSECRRVLTPKASYVPIGGKAGRWIAPFPAMIKLLVLSLFATQKVVMFIAKSNPEDLTFIRQLIEAGKVTPVIDRSFRLIETREAVRYQEAGHARGKVVITVA